MRMAIGILNSIVSIRINTPPLSRGSTGDLSVGDGFGYKALVPMITLGQFIGLIILILFACVLICRYGWPS